MAKNLLLMRHAKSSWDDPKRLDWERPIIENGIRKTQRIINYINQNNVKIDLIVSSHAVRALETACLLAEGLGRNPEIIEVNNNIYESNTESLLSEVYALPDNVDNILILGHNPTFTQFCNRFLDKKIDYIPTSGLVSLKFETNSWAYIENCKNHLNFIAFPKKLK